MNEFEIIDRYFRALDVPRDDVLLGIGDDAALIAPCDKAQVVCTDTLVADVHFSQDDDPADIGFKSLAVNLSDLAAMGASPAWTMLNLVLPAFDAHWLERFCRGFGELAKRYRVALVGGDTTRGPLTISVQAGGSMTARRALRRDAARPGQGIFLSAPIGDGHLGLEVARGAYRPPREDTDYLLQRLRRPEPAIRQGTVLAGIASAAIDVSDGLLADLGHVLAASGGLGAELAIGPESFSPAARRWLDGGGDMSRLMTGGDDYVLCFTVDPAMRDTMHAACAGAQFEAIDIGMVINGEGLVVRDAAGRRIGAATGGYRHFGPS